MSLPDFDETKEMNFDELNDLFWKEANEVIDGIEDDIERERLKAFTWNMLERQRLERINCPFDCNSSDPKERKRFHDHMMAYSMNLIADKSQEGVAAAETLTDKYKILEGHTVQLEAKIDAIIKELE